MHTFYKYQGTGNDFVIIDNRQQIFDKNNTKLVANLCDRRFGIGADGLILLENHSEADFKMVYYNSDGNESTMCGNGGRCISAFAKFLKIIDEKGTFVATDGLHEVRVEKDLVKLKMQDVKSIQNNSEYIFLDTGSPHYVTPIDDLDTFDVKNEGAKIRYSEKYREEGTNVNFVKRVDDSTFQVRTYERGVEDETLSCGTGVTAVALAMHFIGETNEDLVTLITQGGTLKIALEKDNSGYKNIWLIGPAKLVYTGQIEW